MSISHRNISWGQNATAWFAIIFLFGISNSIVLARQLPSTDIYLVGMQGGRIDTTVHKVKNITNRSGYDNQPAFSNDGTAIVYTSDKSGSSNDIYRYSIDRGVKFRKQGFSLQLSYSDVDEFSPRPSPVRGYSVIIVEGNGLQRLWNLLGDALSGNPVLPDLSPVGYYAWVDDDRVAVYVLGDPVTLQIANVSTGKTDLIASDIGRALYRIPGTTEISFVHKLTSSQWVIKKVDPDTGTVSEVAPTYGDGEDFVWTPSGKLLMSSGTAIYEWLSSEKKWRLFHDFKNYGIGPISRLAVSPQADMLAFVAAR